MEPEILYWSIKIEDPAELVLLFQAAQNRCGNVQYSSGADSSKPVKVIQGIARETAEGVAQSLGLKFTEGYQPAGKPITSRLERIQILVDNGRSSLELSVPETGYAEFQATIMHTEFLFSLLVSIARIFGEDSNKKTKELSTQLIDGRPLNHDLRLTRTDREASMYLPYESILKAYFGPICKGRIDITTTTKKLSKRLISQEIRNLKEIVSKIPELEHASNDINNALQFLKETE